MSERSYDFVLFGATGYTGGLTAEYLARHAPRGARWALAGRNRDKLDAVRAGLARINPACAALELLVVDARDSAGLARVAAQSKVVVSTVGPYALHGEPLVRACADAGSHYCDLTGEPEFVDAMWLKYQAVAERSGAKLVHCCGFDSIPHDLGAYYTLLQLPEGVPVKIEGNVRFGGRFSAGTYHSLINAFARARGYLKINRERRMRETRPLLRKIGGSRTRPRYDRTLASWLLPMPTIDPQIVKRSAVALDRYGPEFRYGHYLQVSKLPKALALVAGVGALFAGAQFRLSRDFLLARQTSGEGPSAKQREQGWFRVRFVGEAGGQRVVVDVKGGDPGYGETAKMLAESTLALAYDNLPARAGQLTPVTAMGDALLLRLQKAGISFDVVERT
ncbi:MAG: saccharopine dehydrogenase [Nevskiaceae bacterium]|nr:MAG: saccharopine dehydrogenase [Nevskiaceae bacterium]TAM27317.1 MAG: saccharopine dehydrogenase [Nevskiaceae bacterium]